MSEEHSGSGHTLAEKKRDIFGILRAMISAKNAGRLAVAA
jgi:hypothetical protein